MGTIAGALAVLDRLKDTFDLNIDAHTAPGGSQIRGASGSAVRKILKAHGETRPFLKEGGRTNRGLRGDIQFLLKSFESAGFKRLSAKRRSALLFELQRFLVDRVRDFHTQKRLVIVYDPAKSTWQSVREVLSKAAEVGKEGAIAQYLIGAKLELRFPDRTIGNESYSTADEPLGRKGDFVIGDAVFHVTVAPMPGLYEKCRRNLEEGFKVYLLVPDRVVTGTKQLAELQAPGSLTVISIESFVSQNLDELSVFSTSETKRSLLSLLETYNRRVDLAETNKSMMIEIPINLLS